MKNINQLTINGHQVRATHSSTIASVLSDRNTIPSVESKGRNFYNQDSWTLRIFVALMCDWAQKNKGCTPTIDQIKEWVSSANNKVGSIVSAIVIAATEDNLDRDMLLALVGGGYHEAWHTRYSMRGRLDWRIVVPNVLKRWAQIENWAPFHNELQKWNNIIEDIRIERVGIKEFPPTRTSMIELQDFVLNLEKQGLEGARAHGHSGERNALSVISGTFRDLGLGYFESALQREIILSYEKDNKQGYDLVNEGALRPLLDKAINLTDSTEDKYQCLWIAMDVIITLCEESESEGDEGDGGDNGKPQETKCPNCGAHKSKLKIRKGNNGQYLLVCTDCGHQQEVEICDGGEGGQGEGETFEMEDPQDPQEPNGGEGEGEGETSDDTNGENEGEGGSEKGEDTDEGDDTNGEGGEGSDTNDKPTIYKVGDRAMLNGVEVQVVKASKPDANGLQDLQVEPV